jgi:hypothetical protein
LPCILDIQTGYKKCIDIIKKYHPDAYDISGIRWSLDGNQIYYIFYSNNNEIKSGLCIYDLSNGEEFCPTEGLPGFDTEKAVENYSVSPDENFFAFSFGDSCYGCDYVGISTITILSVDGKISYSLGNNAGTNVHNHLFDYGSILETLAWRPNIVDKP